MDAAVWNRQGRQFVLLLRWSLPPVHDVGGLNRSTKKYEYTKHHIPPLGTTHLFCMSSDCLWNDSHEQVLWHADEEHIQIG